jgi:hypothetical protein
MLLGALAVLARVTRGRRGVLWLALAALLGGLQIHAYLQPDGAHTPFSGQSFLADCSGVLNDC